MLRYAAKRVLTALAVLITVSILAFALTEASVDQAAALAGADATASDIARIRRDYGLDRPMPERYLAWAGRALRGDLGLSLHYKQPVMTLIAERMPVTAMLALSSIAFALAIALPLGIGGALAPGRLLDRLGVAVAVFGQAVPSFWTSLMLIVIFGVDLGWLPISGSDTPATFVMPTIALGLFTMPVLLRLTRAGMLDVLGSEYVRAARARGLRPARVVLKHALRNAAMPLVAVAAVQFGYLLGGSIVTEQIFAMHGVGYLAWQAILIGDTAIVQAIVLLMTFVYAALTLGSDLLNAWFDPRIRMA